MNYLERVILHTLFQAQLRRIKPFKITNRNYIITAILGMSNPPYSRVWLSAHR